MQLCLKTLPSFLRKQNLPVSMTLAIARVTVFGCRSKDRHREHGKLLLRGAGALKLLSNTYTQHESKEREMQEAMSSTSNGAVEGTDAQQHNNSMTEGCTF